MPKKPENTITYVRLSDAEMKELKQLAFDNKRSVTGQLTFMMSEVMKKSQEERANG